MRQVLLLGSGTHYKAFNTEDSGGAPITLAGSPALRASINGGDYVNAGLTLSVDHDYNGASAVTGLHRIALDVDNGTLALVDGDEVDIFLSAGTVDGVSKAGRLLWSVVVVDDGFTTAQLAEIQAEAEDGIAAATGRTNIVIQTGSSGTVLNVDVDAGSDVRNGFLRLTSGTLQGESRRVKWTGTTMTVLAHSSMDNADKQFSGSPANGVTAYFTPLGG